MGWDRGVYGPVFVARLLVLVVEAMEDRWDAGASVDGVGFCEGVDNDVDSVDSLTEVGEVAGVEAVVLEAEEAVTEMAVEDVELSSEVLMVVLEGAEELETSDGVARIDSEGDATG